jgi:hypothetical protein
MKLKAKLRPIDKCLPLFMDDDIPGTAIANNGETVKAVLSRKNGDVQYLTPEGAPLMLIVKFFEYDPP